MADYNIKATITGDSKGYESAVKKAQTASKNLSKSISGIIQGLGKNGLVGAFGAVGLAAGGVTATLGAVVKIARNVSKTINECTEAYKKQLNAERALDTAIQNSPLLSGSASKNLKEFASQIQKTSNMGDEELLPMMSQLVATGRNEAEIMKIIQTATDMAATGTISFDTAVTQLNATLNGSVGRLGQQNAELKGLTEEELKNGKAVDILAEKYKGMAANTIDSSKQLQNAIGDLKESFGTVFEKAFSPMRKYFAEVIQGWADARKAKQEYEGATEAVAEGNADINQMQTVLDANQKKLDEFNKFVEKKAEEFHKTREEIIQNWIMYLNQEDITKYSEGDLFGPKQAEELEKQNKLLQNKISYLTKVEELNKKLNQKMAEYDQQREEEKAAEEEIALLKEKYLAKISEQEVKWNYIEKVTGKVIDNEEKIKFYEDNLVSIMTEAGGQITTNNQYYKDQMAIINELQKKIADANAPVITEKVSTQWSAKLRDQMIDSLKEQRDLELSNSKTTEEEKIKIKKAYNKKILELEEERITAEMNEEILAVQEYDNSGAEELRIREYYANEIIKLRKEYNEIAKDVEEQTWKDIVKTWVKGAKDIIAKITPIMKKVIDVFRKIGNTIKSAITSAFSSMGNIFKKLFNFNTNDALDGLLEFEDKVLTFFVETLPNLPSFVASAVQSIGVLFKNLTKTVDKKQLVKLIKEMVKTLSSNLPSIIKDIIILGQGVLSGLIQGIQLGLPDLIMDSLGIITEITNALITAMPQLFEFLQNMGDLLLPVVQQVIDNFVKFIGEFLKNGIPAFMDILFDVLGLLLKNIPQIVTVLVEALPTLIESFLNGLVDFVSTDMPQIVQELLKMLPTLIKIAIEIVAALIKALPEILGGLITGIVKIFTDTDWTSLASSIFKGLKDGFLSVGDALGSLMKAPINLIIRGLNGIIGGLNKISISIPDWVPGIGGKKFGVNISKIAELARGTQAAYKGLTLVGEAGPELVNFKGGEQVINNRNTQKLLADNGKGGSVFNVTFNNTQDTTAFAMMQQLKQYQRNMAFNSVM